MGRKNRKKGGNILSQDFWTFSISIYSIVYVLKRNEQYNTYLEGKKGKNSTKVLHECFDINIEFGNA